MEAALEVERELQEQGWRIDESLEEFWWHQQREEKQKEVDTEDREACLVPVKGDRLHTGVSKNFSLLLFFANNFLREGRWVCKACTAAKWQCAMLGADTIKVSQKRMEDMGEGSSSRKKWKRKEEDEIKAELGLVVEELWRRVVTEWEESEWWQEPRLATVTMALGHIADNVWELLDRLVPEEKEKGKEKGTEMEEMETEETEEAEEMGAGTEKDRDGDMEWRRC